MEPELLTTKQAASVMNIGEERARAILLSRGVQPVSLPWGKERKTLRWSRRAVITVIDTLHAEAQAKAGVPKRRRSLKTAGCVIGKSAEELFAEFNMGPSSSGWHGPLCSGAIQYGHQTKGRP